MDSLEGNFCVDPDMLEQNLSFGTPEAVTANLRADAALGVDAYIWYASMGMETAQQKRALPLFTGEVMPGFAEKGPVQDVDTRTGV